MRAAACSSLGFGLGIGIGRVDERGNDGGRGDHLVQQLQPRALRATSPFCQHEFAEAAIQHRSTAVRTAYHVPMMYQGAIVATMDWLYPLSGFVVGAIVGLTGMGGGSLMTPLLILLFGVHPLTAVGTDLLYAAVTKTAGTAIHSKKGNVDWRVAGLWPPDRSPSRCSPFGSCPGCRSRARQQPLSYPCRWGWH